MEVVKMKQIITLGGGGFSMEPHNPLLDTYILRQSNKVNPKICFVPTASGDSENYIAGFYYHNNAFRPTYHYFHLQLEI